jgi:hypothetical protein
MNDTLVGKEATLFTDGGWEVSGRIIIADDSKIVIQHAGQQYLVFRNKISVVAMASEQEIEPIARPKYNSNVSEKVDSEPKVEFEANAVGPDNNYGSIIPGDMLDGEPMDGEHLPTEFSISQGRLRSVEYKVRSELGNNDPIK